jgi:hypothetical protein
MVGGDSHTVYERREGETTEWEDLLRKHKILRPAEPVWRPDSYAPAEEVARNSTHHVDAASREELEDLEYDDDRFLEEYRRKRLEELQRREAAARGGPGSGTVEEITRTDFVHKVTEASKERWVVCHLYKKQFGACLLMSETLAVLAEHFRGTTFVQGVSTDVIPNYPDANLPTLLVYHEGKLVKNFVGVLQFAGLPTPHSECL